MEPVRPGWCSSWRAKARWMAKRGRENALLRTIALLASDLISSSICSEKSVRRQWRSTPTLLLLKR
eukprot:7391494-Heterocapsa_arctica.AAC.1